MVLIKNRFFEEMQGCRAETMVVLRKCGLDPEKDEAVSPEKAKKGFAMLHIFTHRGTGRHSVDVSKYFIKYDRERGEIDSGDIGEPTGAIVSAGEYIILPVILDRPIFGRSDFAMRHEAEATQYALDHPNELDRIAEFDEYRLNGYSLPLRHYLSDDILKTIEGRL